jgi:hypothetical protein
MGIELFAGHHPFEKWPAGEKVKGISKGQIIFPDSVQSRNSRKISPLAGESSCAKSESRHEVF